MKLVICLGNPGREYENSRHNAGFKFAQNLAAKMNIEFSNEPKFKSHIAKGIYNSETVWIVKPLTYMNLSGEALSLIKNFYKIDLKDLFVVFDDISLNLGELRFRSKGSAGGHNGVKSIIKHASSEEFDRLKIGIGAQPPYMKSEDFVLQNFSNEQNELLLKTINKAVDAFFYYLDFGITKAQNKYN